MGPHEEGDSVHVQEWSGSELVISSNEPSHQNEPLERELDLSSPPVREGNLNEWPSHGNRHRQDQRRMTNVRHSMNSDTLLAFQSYQISRTRWGRTLRTRSRRFNMQEKERQKRHVLQDMARPLKQWLIRHRGHPYPSKLEKIALALGSQMTLVQVSNWFANARRRLKNTVRGQGLTWSQRVRMYNSYVSGNAETLSIDSDDSIWDSDSEEEKGQQESQEVSQIQGLQRSYKEHEEHSYFSSAPLSDKSQETNKCGKRSIGQLSGNTTPEEDPTDHSPVKRQKLRCGIGSDRFARCIHHVYPGNPVFQNGSSANEGVKVSPWQKSDDDNSRSVADSSSSAVSSDEFEDEKRDSLESYDYSHMFKTKNEGQEKYLDCLDFAKDETDILSKAGERIKDTPAKYKSAILHRYLRDASDGSPNPKKRPHRGNAHTPRAVFKLEKQEETNNSSKRKKLHSAKDDEATDTKRNCDRCSTNDREYLELEAAEVLTNLSRSSNMFSHKISFNNHPPHQ